ncbi:hypothetical protein BD410DRAFT_769511 [Rickenella mellea]|uniref:PH domain-containing protein n=1 Tax=Rickenella mellea TaxID=50990 RepID=A0A4Y7Q7G7_9AGAM|nr:hypothetical protein BD410DRAFT_769511 [Rickenella mellea]
MPPSPGFRPHNDAMKGTILRESTAGWSNAVSPLRIAKRDSVTTAHNDDAQQQHPQQKQQQGGKVLPRRSSNSYKHVMTNNLVSKSPFKSQIPTSSTRSAAQSSRVSQSPSPRKISGEKRPRPESLVSQAEAETAHRTRELGFKRRQSKAFQHIIEKEPVTKSPFRQRVVSPPAPGAAVPIPITLPRHNLSSFNMNTDDDTTSIDSEASKENKYSYKHDVFDSPPPVPPPKDKTTEMSPLRPLTPQHQRNSASPMPSSFQISPTRSSLVSKKRLLGPRSRSVSNSPSDTPTRRERRVTFNERCNVVEFDRESHEDVSFTTADEDEGGGHHREDDENDGEDSLDSLVNSTVILPSTTDNNAHSPNNTMLLGDMDFMGSNDNSISGLVDSMLQEVSAHHERPDSPLTPTHTLSFLNPIHNHNHPTQSADGSGSILDADLLVKGGTEGGVPHGRTHHAERAREERERKRRQFQEAILEEADETVRHDSFGEGSGPGEEWGEGREKESTQRERGDEGKEDGDEPSFSSIELSTPPKTPARNAVNARLRDASFGAGSVNVTAIKLTDNSTTSFSSASNVTAINLGAIPNTTKHDKHDFDEEDDEEDEEAQIDKDVRMLPPTPSPAKRTVHSGGNAPRSKEAPDGLVPRFDLNLSGTRNGRERDDLEDPFGKPTPPRDHKDNDKIVSSAKHNQDAGKFKLELDFDVSHASIASFHEFPSPPQLSKPAPAPARTLPTITGNTGTMANTTTDLHTATAHKSTSASLTASNSAGSSELEVGRGESFAVDGDGDIDMPGSFNTTRLSASSSQLQSQSQSTLNTSSSARIDTPPVSCTKLNTAGLVGSGSQASIASSGTSNSGRSPRISREDVKRRVEMQRGASASPIRVQQQQVDTERPMSPLESPLLRKPEGNAREPVTERLRKAVDQPEPNAKEQERAVEAKPSSTTMTNGMHHLPEIFDFGQPGVEIADMRSALDRLVDDVNRDTGGTASVGGGNSFRLSQSKTRHGADKGKKRAEEVDLETPDISMADTEATEETEDEDSMDIDGPGVIVKAEHARKAVARANTAPALGLSLPSSFDLNPQPVSRVASAASTFAPAVPSKDTTSHDTDAIKMREEQIREHRRRAKAKEMGEFMPPRRDSGGNLMEFDTSGELKGVKAMRLGVGRPSARRSLSTGVAEDLMSAQPGAQRRVSALMNQRGGVLGMPIEDAEDPLSDSIERALRKYDDGADKMTYQLREREGTIYASSSQEETVSHMSRVGDIDSGKAWRPVRRPSDMNEYSRQIREYRSQEKPGKAHGKVFVKVLGVKNLVVPLPYQPTVFTCTLNNGIHFVTTPESQLTRDSRIEQEFELIEHGKLEFTLTLKVRKDPHIAAQFKAVAPAAPPPPQIAAPQSSTRGGMRSFFGGNSKKSKQISQQMAPPAGPARIEENLARYLKPDGTLARAFISFKEIASRCDTRLFETSYQLIGQRLEGSGVMAPRPIGEIVLQVFRLPPLPGIPPDQLPQSLEECHRGLRHINWHKVTYHEGTLTQLGGDCTTWRRRQLRVIGANLVAFNDVTKKATATIDLKKAITVEDDQAIRGEGARSPASATTARSTRDIDDFDGIYGVERSFRLIFPHGQEIAFFADTDEEKTRWLEVFRALVGRIPPNPLWAELIWQRQDELARNALARRGTGQLHSTLPQRPESRQR